jgi:predicted pyridoxine 5'-phosphate oxidase superfamily flavin-nucleotide-binding protein
MIRTQIQLEPRQWDMLKRVAQQQNTSVADLIRRSIDRFAREHGSSFDETAKIVARGARAEEIFGKYDSGVPNLSEDHDQYLEEIYAS